MARKRKPTNDESVVRDARLELGRRRRGRPSNGLSEVRHELRTPAELMRLAEEAAESEGVTLTEWIRRAMRARLGS